MPVSGKPVVHIQPIVKPATQPVNQTVTPIQPVVQLPLAPAKKPVNQNPISAGTPVNKLPSAQQTKTPVIQVPQKQNMQQQPQINPEDDGQDEINSFVTNHVPQTMQVQGQQQNTVNTTANTSGGSAAQEFHPDWVAYNKRFPRGPLQMISKEWFRNELEKNGKYNPDTFEGQWMKHESVMKESQNVPNKKFGYDPRASEKKGKTYDPFLHSKWEIGSKAASGLIGGLVNVGATAINSNFLRKAKLKEEKERQAQEYKNLYNMTGYDPGKY